MTTEGRIMIKKKEKRKGKKEEETIKPVIIWKQIKLLLCLNTN